MAFKHDGVTRCRDFVGNTKVCVYGAKYGWSAWLVASSGQKLAPLSIRAQGRGGRDKSPGAAITSAMQVARRIRNGGRAPR